MFKLISNKSINKGYIAFLRSSRILKSSLIQSQPRQDFHLKEKKIKEIKDKKIKDGAINESNQLDEKASISKLYKYFKPYFDQKGIRKMLFYSLILTIGSKGLVSMSPYFLKMTINTVLDKTTIWTPIMFLVGAGLSKIVGTILNEYRQIILNKVSSLTLISFSKDMMNHVMKLNFQILKNNSETVINSFSKSLAGIERFNRFVLGNVMSNTIEVIIISIMLYTMIGPKYFLNTIVTYSIYMITTRIISNKRMKYIKAKYNSEINSENKIYDIIYNVETVKYFQKEECESTVFSNTVKEIRQNDQKVVSSLSFLNIVQSLIISVGMVANLSMGIYDCYYSLMTPGDLVMLQAIFMQMIMPLNFIGMLMREIDETRINLQSAIQLIKKKEKAIQEQRLQPNFVFQSGLIEFKNVSFGYNSNISKNIFEDDKNISHGKLILNDFSAIFYPNTINAVIGYSGQGKSTIFNLIYKLYLPTNGQIIVDHQDLSLINAETYRRHLSIYPQNGHLFNESILSNISYGHPEAKIEEVENITKSVNIYNNIKSLDEGFSTNVGTLGSKLSGGEKQRILLARTFLKQSEIVLLDEPTSSLDSYNENLVLDYLSKNKTNKTILISSHKLSTIMKCDLIYVLDKGKLAECGDHHTLLKKNGIYSEIFKKSLLA